MNDDDRRRIVEYVRPLAVGLDGVADFGDVERLVGMAQSIAAGREDVDADRLFLLAAFSGQRRRVGRPGQSTRAELFLASAGVTPAAFRSLAASLARLASRPSTPEEECVHDARRLEEIGAYGIVRLAAAGSRERQGLAELAREIEREARDDLRTPRGKELAAPRLEAMRAFARHLREEIAEFAAG